MGGSKQGMGRQLGGQDSPTPLPARGGGGKPDREQARKAGFAGCVASMLPGVRDPAAEHFLVRTLGAAEGVCWRAKAIRGTIETAATGGHRWKLSWGARQTRFKLLLEVQESWITPIPFIQPRALGGSRRDGVFFFFFFFFGGGGRGGVIVMPTCPSSHRSRRRMMHSENGGHAS